MKISRIGWWLLYVFWGVMIAGLLTGIVNRPRGRVRTPDELLARVEMPAESSWMGIYINGAKAGYIHSELTPLINGGYSIRELSHISGLMMGTQQQMRLSMTVVTDSTLALSSFEGRLDADPYSTVFSGAVKENVLSINLTTGGRTSNKFIPAPEPLYLSQAVKPLLQSGKFGRGDSLKLAGFDPLSLEMQDLIVVGADLKTHRLWGQDVLARKLTTRMAGFESEVFVDADGNTLAEFGPLGMVMRREDMEMALSGGNTNGAVDFLAMYAIKPVGEIIAPRRASRTLLKLSNVDAAAAASASDRQTIFDSSEGTVEIRAVPSPGVLSDADFERFTQDAPYIESRSRAIRQAAVGAVIDGASRIDTLQKLSNWVFRSVDKQMSAGIPSALAVLQIRTGDCNEHSVLFTAMARALGIPTRIELGAVYQRGRFWFHAWPACWVDRSWVEFDPTLGLPRADAARIAFAAGDMTDVVKLASIIGKVEIEIVESE